MTNFHGTIIYRDQSRIAKLVLLLYNKSHFSPFFYKKKHCTSVKMNKISVNNIQLV